MRSRSRCARRRSRRSRARSRGGRRRWPRAARGRRRARAIARSCADRAVVEQQEVGAGLDGGDRVGFGLDLDLDAQAGGRCGARGLHRERDSAGEGDVVVLEQDAVEEPDAVVEGAAHGRSRTCRARASPGASCACRRCARRCPRPRPTKRRAVLATPHMRPRKLSAVRSAARIARRLPGDEGERLAGLGPAPPRRARSRSAASGSTASKTAAAIGSPQTTRRSRASIRARPRDASATTSGVVTSPDPRSSASASSSSESPVAGRREGRPGAHARSMPRTRGGAQTSGGERAPGAGYSPFMRRISSRTSVSAIWGITSQAIASTRSSAWRTICSVTALNDSHAIFSSVSWSCARSCGASAFEHGARADSRPAACAAPAAGAACAGLRGRARRLEHLERRLVELVGGERRELRLVGERRRASRRRNPRARRSARSARRPASRRCGGSARRRAAGAARADRRNAGLLQVRGGDVEARRAVRIEHGRLREVVGVDAQRAIAARGRGRRSRTRTRRRRYRRVAGGVEGRELRSVGLAADRQIFEAIDADLAAA